MWKVKKKLNIVAKMHIQTLIRYNKMHSFYKKWRSETETGVPIRKGFAQNDIRDSQ